MVIPNLFSNIIFCPVVNICNMSVTKEQYLEQLETELHKPVKKNFRRRKVYVPHLDHTHSADLVDMKGFSRQNKGYKYILNIIDIWSRYAWSVPLKTKTGVEVAQAFATVFKESGRIPQFLWVDQGKEFYNSHMTELLELHGIKRYSTYGEGKAVVVERLNRFCSL
jgi:transposase InsO family protein